MLPDFTYEVFYKEGYEARNECVKFYTMQGVMEAFMDDYQKHIVSKVLVTNVKGETVLLFDRTKEQ